MHGVPRSFSLPLVTFCISVAAFAAAPTTARAANEDVLPPERVTVRPVFLVPKGEQGPDAELIQKLQRHLNWSREWLHDALGGRDTLTLFKGETDIVPLSRPLQFYRSLEDGGAAGHWVGELLDRYDVSRFHCPWILCCVVMNSTDDWPVGGGRTINGGFARGGGFLQVSSTNLEGSPNFQSTLRHELCHACGLPHVDVYGYDMHSNRSVMAYNPDHHTDGFREARVPAELIPEDLRGLALNQLALRNLRFDASRDLQATHQLPPRVVSLGPMSLPGHPDYEPRITTTSGADHGTDPQNVHTEILPSSGPGITFKPNVMWETARQPDRRVTLTIRFPTEVTLSAIRIHTQHSGRYHRAEAIMIQAKPASQFVDVVSTPISDADQTVSFEETTAQDWRLTLQTGESGRICFRGLQYFASERQLLPPRVPENWRVQLGLD